MDVEEAIANGYADWKVEREKGGSTPLGKLFQKMQDFWYRLKSVFTGIENLHDVLRRVESGEVWEREADNPQERLARDEKAFGELVDALDEQDETKLQPVMQTPLVLQMVGAKDLPIKIRHSDLKKITTEKHGDAKSAENVKKLPSQMADPVAIFKSATRDDSYVMMLELTDENGSTYIAPVALEKTDEQGFKINQLTSAYGKGGKSPQNNWFATQEKNGKLLYVNRKKASNWSETTGVQFPNAPHQNGALSDSSIKHEGDLVKLKNEFPTKYSLFKKSDVPHSTRVMRIIEKGTGVKIAWGHTQDNVNVYYDERNKVIRSRDANNFRVVIPRVAEVYCNMLNVGITNNNGRRTLDPAMRDYVNDFILTGAGNRANTREARAFEAAMRNNPAVAENIMDLRAEFERYNHLSDAEKAMENVKYDTGKPITKKRIKAELERLASRFVDEQLPIYNLSVELAKTVKKAGGKLRASADPYISMRVAKGAVSQAARMILPPQGRIMAQTSTNKEFIKQEIGATKAMLRRNFPSVPSSMIDKFKPLWLILQDAGVKEGDKSYQKLTTYLVAKRMLGIYNTRLTAVKLSALYKRVIYD